MFKHNPIKACKSGRIAALCLAAGIFFAVFPLTVGCSSRAALFINADKSARIEFKTYGGKVLEDTAAAFTGSSETALFDEQAVRKSFAAYGFDLSELSFLGKTGIQLKASVPDMDKSIAGNMLKTEKNGQEEIMTLTLSPDYIRALMRMIPDETAEFTDFLMAPLFTGEKMSADEYAELVGSVYGKAMREDLKKAFFFFDVYLSSPITRASIFPEDAGTVRMDGKKVRFALSLNKFLSNSDKIIIRIYQKI